MTKRKRNNRKRSENDNDLVKPEYAMDKMEPKAKPEPEKPKEETFHVGDALRDSTAVQLAKLKESLTTAEEEKKPRPAPSGKTATKTKRSSNRSAEERFAENPDLSFAELFDPAEDEESSFEDLLEDSKLDWRFFKDE